jgi:hypothetical protein
MIITKLSGGLGNQMFQYAAGRAVAYRNNTVLKMDLSFYKNQSGITPRQYEMSPFNIPENFSSDQDKETIKGRSLPVLVEKTFRKLSINLYKPGYIQEKSHDFDSTILNLPDNVYLDGYWQSDQYFSDIADIIKSEFTLKKNYLVPDLLERINNRHSVSVHIRRGDYISDSNTNKYHGVCSGDYYQQAISYIARQFPDLLLFIFSDDLEWCRQNLKIDQPKVFIEGNKNYEDLILMSHCQHNIIANSSFSWWGAWLNSNPHKIVITPGQWFADKNVGSTGLIPESWIKI